MEIDASSLPEVMLNNGAPSKSPRKDSGYLSSDDE